MSVKGKSGNKTQSGVWAIYIRVSTGAQRDEGYSMDAQKEMLSAYCVSKGIKNFEYYIDGGFTGSNMDRPELDRLIGDVRSGKINCVLVFKLDRLSRSQKDTLYLIEDVFNPHSVDFISLNESMDTSTPLGRLMLGILSAFAQLERENIRERTRMGMRERIKAGYWMGGGRVPFGYDYDKEQGILVPNKDAETVRKIYDLYLKGFSSARIARMLGLKYDRLVTQILTRKSNMGIIVYNDEEFIGRHEAIISAETYNKAMEYMAERAVKRVTESEYLLTGLMVCGKCGAKMRYQKWGKRDCKIVCYSQDKSKPHLVKDSNCDNTRISSTALEDELVKDIFSFSLRQEKPSGAAETSHSVLDILNRRYNEISKKIKRLYALYSDDGNELLLEAIENLRKELKAIQNQIEREHESMATSTKIESVKNILSTIKEAWEYMTNEERKKVVRSCVDKVVITGNNVEIFYKFQETEEDPA